jgi:hypothetical protein
MLRLWDKEQFSHVYTTHKMEFPKGKIKPLLRELGSFC